MSLFAYRDGEIIRVAANSGGIEVRVSEDLEHLRSFWAGLGVLLREADAEAAAESEAGGF